MNRTYSLQPTGPRGWCKYRRGGICIWTAIASENIWRGAQYIHEMTGDHPRGPVRLYKRRWWWSLIFISVFFKKNKKRSSLSPFQLLKEKEKKKRPLIYALLFFPFITCLERNEHFQQSEKDRRTPKMCGQVFYFQTFFFLKLKLERRARFFARQFYFFK